MDNIFKKSVLAMKLKKNCKVLVHAFADEEELKEIYSLMGALNEIEIEPYLILESTSFIQSLFKSGKQLPEGYFDYLKEIDVVIDLFYYEGPKVTKDFSKEMISAYQQYLQGFFRIASTKEKLVQMRMPSKDQALSANMDINEFKQLVSNAYDLNYSDLIKESESLVTKYSEKKEYYLVSSNGDKLFLDLTNRNWITDCGDGDFPCGEIYIAPNEEKTNGKVYFARLCLEEGLVFTELEVEIEAGKIIKSNIQEFMDYLNELPPNGNVIAELGIGLNPNVSKISGIPFLDEKMKGTMHLGLGANIMFGGTNDSMCHLDLVGSFSLLGK